MNELKVTGNQNFMGKEIPVVAGGFGKNAKCVSDRTIAEIHGQPVFEIRRRIGDNIKRFNETVDFIDLKQRMGQSHTLDKGVGEAGTLELLLNLGYAKQSITQAEHIYLLSERGYAKLIKIMDTDLAWEIHDKLIDEYFQMKSQFGLPQSGKAKRPPLSSVNMMVKNVMSTLEKAKVEPVFVAAEVKRLYTDLGYEVKASLLTDERTMPKLYDCTEIAKELGITSKNGLPHNQAVGDIIRKLDLDDGEIKTTAFSRNGHEDVTVQYTPPVLDKVSAWLERNNYPTKIPYTDSKGNSKIRTVSYRWEETE